MSRRPMRIAVLCLEKGGGLAHYAYELARALAGQVHVGCHLAAQNEIRDAFAALPCAVRMHPLRRGARSLLLSMVSGRDAASIAAAIAAEDPDIVLDAGSGPWGSMVLRHLRHRMPIAQVVHDPTPHPDVRSVVESIPSMLQGRVADVRIGLSDFASLQLERRYTGQPCIRSRLGVLVPGGAVDVAAVAARRHRNLFLGRINPYKGLPTLVEAFAIARSVRPTLELSVVGRGRIESGLLDRMSQLGIALDNRYVPDAEIARVVADHGVMVLPYTSATQSGIAAVALANGMPSVATSVGALPEQVLHERNGLVVPPRDPEALAQAMLAISADAALAARMAEQALAVGRELYAWDAIACELLKELSRFLADGGRHARSA